MRELSALRHGKATLEARWDKVSAELEELESVPTKSLCVSNVDRMYRISQLNEELSDLAEWIHAHDLAIAKEEKKLCAS